MGNFVNTIASVNDTINEEVNGGEYVNTGGLD